MPRLVQIDGDVHREIEKVKKYALEHIYDDVAINAIKLGIAEIPGDNPEHVVHIHQGFRAVYTVHLKDSIKYHHLSVSYENGWIGIPEAELILEQFGMGSSIQETDHLWLEDKARAVNFLKKMK